MSVDQLSMHHPFNQQQPIMFENIARAPASVAPTSAVYTNPYHSRSYTHHPGRLSNINSMVGMLPPTLTDIRTPLCPPRRTPLLLTHPCSSTDRLL